MASASNLSLGFHVFCKLALVRGVSFGVFPSPLAVVNQSQGTPRSRCCLVTVGAMDCHGCMNQQVTGLCRKRDLVLTVLIRGVIHDALTETECFRPRVHPHSAFCEPCT